MAAAHALLVVERLPILHRFPGKRRNYPGRLRTTAHALDTKAPFPGLFRGFKKHTPEGTRTPNLLIRSQTLYPIELRVLCAWRGAEESAF